MSVRAYVSVGSNVDREANIVAAVAMLREVFGGVLLSRVYETEAVGFDGPSFFNMVVSFETDLSPEAVAARLRAIEDSRGRVRSGSRFSSRTLDLDLVLYGDQVQESETCRLPRDEVARYAFVLGPLAEIAPLERHPLSGRTFGELWQEMLDEGGADLQPVSLEL